MRTYPRNSPQAATRIVALVLMSDGHVCSSEERALERLDLAGKLRLAPGEFDVVMRELCEDLEVANPAFGPNPGHVDDATLATLLAEIDAPALRRTIVDLCVAAALADGHLADGEISTLAAITRAWPPVSRLVSGANGSRRAGRPVAA